MKEEINELRAKYFELEEEINASSDTDYIRSLVEKQNHIKNELKEEISDLELWIKFDTEYLDLEDYCDELLYLKNRDYSLNDIVDDIVQEHVDDLIERSAIDYEWEWI